MAVFIMLGLGRAEALLITAVAYGLRVGSAIESAGLEIWEDGWDVLAHINDRRSGVADEGE